jgi:homoserine O-succinyltransferase
MTIILPDGLPAAAVLRAEGIPVADRSSVAVDATLSASPLRIGLLNLMPRKVATETQIARLLGCGGADVELTLIGLGSYRPRNTSQGHMAAYYTPWPDLRHRMFDGLIITGAPVETMPFEDVAYWREITEILDWSQTNVGASYFICWAAQAALYHFHGVPKYGRPEKAFGVFEQHVLSSRAKILRGFRSTFWTPVSRHTEVKADDLPQGSGLEVLASSPETGLCMIADAAHRAYHMFNHLEYDVGTLRDEYLRDRASGVQIALPRNYFPGDDPSRRPVNGWRAQGWLLFENWLEEVSERARTLSRPVCSPVVAARANARFAGVLRPSAI